MPRGTITTWSEKEKTGIILSGECEVKFDQEDLKRGYSNPQVGDAVIFAPIQRMFYPNNEVRAVNVSKME